MKFYLGTHMPHWLGRTDVPLFVSTRRLQDRRTLPRALGPWALDSGGFTELSMFGEWRTTSRDYVQATRRYADEIGNLEWASPQDWMCEPFVLNKTGLSVAEHQRLTVENLLDLRGRDAALPFIPVLQGWTISDYLRCRDLYAQHGIDLTGEALVGVGSVCRRQHTSEVERIFSTLSAEGLALHGYGLKTEGLRVGAHYLSSADSMSWSFRGRRSPVMCGSTRHVSEANCREFALRWRANVLAAIDAPKQLAFAQATS